MTAASDEDLVTVPSRFSAADTVERLLTLLKSRHVTVFAKVDHAANAASVGLTLRPTVVIIFGDPRVGTALMQDRQTAGIDLPSKILVWEDEAGKVWLGYYTAATVAQRHGLGAASAQSIGKLDAGMTAMAQAVAQG